MESWRRRWSPRSSRSRSRGERVDLVLRTGLMRRPVFDAARDRTRSQPFSKQLHVLAPAAADQPAEFFRSKRKTGIIIDWTPHPRAEEPSNQASQPPHVNSLAPATNLRVRILFLLQNGDCKRPQEGCAKKISWGNSLLRLLRVSRQSRRSARTRRCFHNPNERPWRQSCRRDRLSRRRSTAHAAARLDQRFEFDLKISLPVLPTALQLQHASGCRCDARNLC